MMEGAFMRWVSGVVPASPMAYSRDALFGESFRVEESTFWKRRNDLHVWKKQLS
jgi:hypothetical protein